MCLLLPGYQDRTPVLLGASTRSYQKEMTSKKFKYALRLLATIFLTFITVVAIVEILMHV
jgi:hypothetical protein